jgi:hypothetical protein
MKALRWNPLAVLGGALLSIGTMSLGLLGSWEPIFVASQALGAAAALGMLYRWTCQKDSPRPQYIRVRA